MVDRPVLPSGRGRIASTEDAVAALVDRVFELERLVAALSARLAALETP